MGAANADPRVNFERLFAVAQFTYLAITDCVSNHAVSVHVAMIAVTQSAAYYNPHWHSYKNGGALVVVEQAA